MLTKITEANTLLNTGKGKKISLLIENSIGAIVLRHVTLHKDSAIYQNDLANFEMDRSILMLNLYYVQKGCRKPKGFRIGKDTLLTLALNWQEIEGMEEFNNSGNFSLTNWVCFDPDRYQSLSTQLNSIIYQQPS